MGVLRFAAKCRSLIFGGTTEKAFKRFYSFFIGGNIMLRKKGFTLIEFMVVILVVSILAAVAIPIMRGRIDAAKWSEGKTMAGTVATALRDFAAEEGKDAALMGTAFSSWNADLGFAEGELTGAYFRDADFTISDFVYGPPLEFTITVGTSADNAPATPDGYTLDHNGDWTEL